MKKGLYLIAFLCIGSMLFAQDPAQNQAEGDSVRIKGVHPWKIEQNARGVKDTTAHWSIIPHLGFNAFDGDFTSEMKHNVAIPSAGLALEYNFTPVWSIGIEYMYNQYTITGKTGNGLQNADTLLNGHLHRAGGYLSMDLINLFFPRAQKKIFSLFPYVGAGGAWYKRSAYYMDDRYYDAEKGILYNPTHSRGNTANYINADGEVGPDHDTDYKMVGYLQMGLNLDFNLNRTLALGLRANYTYFTRDYVDGRGYHKQSVSAFSSKNNDGIFDITMNLRFKLEAVSKSHVRNMPSFDAFDKMLAAAEPKIIPHDTIIIHRHDSVIIRETIKPAERAQVYNVYFDNDKYELRQDALVTIQQVADILQANPDQYVIVIGYCDNTGKNEHNFELGDSRAAVVLDEFAQEYGIPSDHMYGKGSGKLVGRRSRTAYGPNRRASIHIVDKETFDLMVLELQGKSEDRDASYEPTFENSRPMTTPRLVPISESSRKQEQDKLFAEYQARQGNKATVEKGLSLTKLARENYDNLYCWVYIYMANKDKISNPNMIAEGTELHIPELTEEELKIKKEECLSLYSFVRHTK